MSSRRSANAAAVKGDEAEELIKNYMLQQYRPYSVTDIVLNLNNRVNKANTSKALENLAHRGELVTKVYGKSAYYVYREIDCGVGEASQEDVDNCKEAVEKLNRVIDELEAEYKALVSAPSTDQLQTQIETTTASVKRLREQAESSSTSSETKLSDSAIQQYKAYSMMLQKTYNHRKKLFFNFVNTIKEGVDDYNSFMATVGIDLDDIEIHK